MNLGSFSDPFKAGFNLSTNDIFTRRRSGGVVRRPVKEEKPEEEDETPESAAEEAEEEKTKVVLKNPKWEAETVGFNEDTEISVELELPAEHASKKKVTFELFAKTPADPERISQVEGFEEGGKAKAKIPVYQPNYLDEEGNLLASVDYYFTAKHSQSDLLKDEKATKTVDGKADRAIESHVMEETTFATDSSFIHPRRKPSLLALRDRIKAWKKKYPDATIALFGHTDAVGKETYNKGLSERRARSLHAFLSKDAKATEALYGEEKWTLKQVQTLLKHLGHDPGLIDGQDGAKTQTAIKSFQKQAGIAEDGKNTPAMREALFKAFADGIHDLELVKKDFEDINGTPFAGCSEFNLAVDTQGPEEKNRRVTVVLLKSSKNFPANNPCKAGDLAKCQAQVKKNAGKRRKASFKCCFYDELMKEEGKGSDCADDVLLPDHEEEKSDAIDDGDCGTALAGAGGGGAGGLPLANPAWNVEKARCGGKVKVSADSSLPDGTEVVIKFSTEELKCDEVKAKVQGGKVEHEWQVKGVGFALNEEKKVLPEVKVFASIEHGGEKSAPEKPLLVQTPVKTEPLTFDKNYSWGIYSVHAKFTQKIWGKSQKVLVKKKVIKTWGATYVNMKDAGITDTIAGMPWAGHRWAKSKSGHMVPDWYWDGKKWKDIPDAVLADPQNFSAHPLVKKGEKYQHPGDAKFEWPETFKEYEFDAAVYANKRKAWIDDSNKRWSKVFKVRRKGCAADPKSGCCTYEVHVEFEMDKVEAYDNHTLCLAPGNLRSNAGLLFYGETRVAMAAHEVGHLVGLPDEYPGGAVDPAATGDGLTKGIDSTTLMGGDLSEPNNKIKKRHYSNFLEMAKRLGKEAGGAEQEWTAVT